MEHLSNFNDLEDHHRPVDSSAALKMHQVLTFSKSDMFIILKHKFDANRVDFLAEPTAPGHFQYRWICMGWV